MTQLGPAVANIEWVNEFGTSDGESWGTVTVLPCGLVHVARKFSGEVTIPAGIVRKIEWRGKEWDKDIRESEVMRSGEDLADVIREIGCDIVNAVDRVETEIRSRS